MIFKPGDIVKYYPYGDREFVLNKSISFKNYPFSIIMENDLLTFTNDGKLSLEHTHPSITLVRRPEEKKQVQRTLWVVKSELNPPYVTGHLLSEEEAKEKFGDLLVCRYGETITFEE